MKTIATMRALDGKYGAIRAEDVFDTDIDDLWQACTDPARLARWIAEVSGDLRVGGRFHATPTYRRDALLAGNRIKGPALIEEYASTTVLMPGDRMTVDAYGNLVIAVAGAK